MSRQLHTKKSPVEQEEMEGIPTAQKNFRGYVVSVLSISITVRCSNCRHYNTGYVFDPRGRIHQCTKCKKVMHIPRNALVEIS